MLYPKIIKPISDIILALIGIVLVLPILVVVALALGWVNRGTPFFLQQRIGKGGKPFTIIKFKTMTDARDASGNFLPDSERLTTLGAWIRKTSIDELPQLINVLKGDMSLIGPRPLPLYYGALYNQFQERRHEVQQGITGWAQVNGRNNTDWLRRFEMDVWYVDNVSFLLDMKILWLTLWKVLRAEDVNEDGHATAGDFQGND